MTIPADCPDCPDAQRAARRRPGAWASCPSCGAEYVSDGSTLPVKRPHRWTLADLDLLARWASSFYGSGLKLREPVQHSGGDQHGPEDNRTSEWHHAAAVHRRFERMRSGPGRTHYAVLWFAFIERDGPARGTPMFLHDLGLSFATRGQRLMWHTQGRTLRVKLPQLYGQRIYDAAVKAWEG